MTDKITLSHTDDVQSLYDRQIIIADDLDLSGEGVVIYTNYDSSAAIMIPKEVFRKFVAQCQSVLAQWDFPK